MASRSNALLPHRISKAAAGIWSSDDGIGGDAIDDPTLLDPAAYRPWVRFSFTRPDWRSAHDIEFDRDGPSFGRVKMTERVVGGSAICAGSVIGLLALAEPDLRRALGPGRRLYSLQFDAAEGSLTLEIEDKTDQEIYNYRTLIATADGRTQTELDPYDPRDVPYPRLAPRLYRVLGELRASLAASLPPAGMEL